MITKVDKMPDEELKVFVKLKYGLTDKSSWQDCYKYLEIRDKIYAWRTNYDKRKFSEMILEEFCKYEQQRN